MDEPETFDLLGEPADLCEGMTPRAYMRALGRVLRMAVAKGDEAAQKAIVGRAELVMARHPYLAPPPPRARLVRPMAPSRRRVNPQLRHGRRRGPDPINPRPRDRGVGVTRAPGSNRVRTMARRVRHANLQARKR